MRYRKTILLLLIAIIAVPSYAHAKKKLTKPTTRAVYHNNQGVSYLNKNDYARAELELKTAIELAPEYVEAYNNLGVVYRKTGRNELAKAQFKKAIKLDKKYAAAYAHLGAVYLAEGDADDAIKVIKKGLKKDSTLADAHYNLGLAYIEKSKTDKKDYLPLAIEQFKIATELNPTLTHVHEKLAEVYEQRGDMELAAIRRRLALADKPESVDQWLKMGELNLRKNDLPKALNAFNKALELAPESPRVHMSLGLYYMVKNDSGSAETEFSVIALEPLNELAWYRLGAVYLRSDQYASAAKAFGKAKEINPNFASASFNLGLTYLRQGKTLAAQKEWEYTTTIAPNYARALYNLGNIYEQRGRDDDAGQMYCRFASAGEKEFPAEIEVARKFIKANDIKCRN